MKIIVRSSELAIPIRIALPTSLLKWDFIWKLIMKDADEEERAELMQYKQLVSDCLTALREHVKRNGHFNLVEFENSDGDYVLIRL